ncbi:hypothetical protein ABBQ38_011772 [Trebouxia sp. C0009 RCD-2024]
MALQVKDLLSSAFGGGLDSLQELQLSRKGLEDVLALASAPNVVNLNISFNKLVSLNGLEKELWLQHNQIAGLSALLPLTTVPSLAALFLSPNPLCGDLKADYRVAVVCTLPSLQALDGQAVSEADRAGAADYSTRQTAQQAANAATEDSNSSPSGTLQRSKTTDAMPRPGLPGSPGRGGPGPKGKSSKHRKSREVTVVTAAHEQQISVVLQPGEAIGFGQVTQQLPKFDIDKHGNRLDRPWDPYGTTTLKGTSTKQDAKPVETVYQTFYGNTSQHQAVIVRSDGSATAQYPSEGVQRGGMRLLATYRSTGLAAVMFEADGTGSVQYPNGNLWMSFTAETGKGALYSHTGEVTRTWTSDSEAPIELLLDQHLVGLKVKYNMVWHVELGWAVGRSH